MIWLITSVIRNYVPDFAFTFFPRYSIGVIVVPCKLEAYRIIITKFAPYFYLGFLVINSYSIGPEDGFSTNVPWLFLHVPELVWDRYYCDTTIYYNFYVKY